jgi:hypothetical protein
MLEETQIMTARNTTAPPGSPDPATNPSPSVDSVAVADGGQRQDSETNTATNGAPCPAGILQIGDQLVPLRTQRQLVTAKRRKSPVPAPHLRAPKRRAGTAPCPADRSPKKGRAAAG